MKSADNKMRRLFGSAAVQTNAAPDDAVFAKIKTAYTRTVECKSTQQEPRMWRSVMKNPSARLAVAAAVIIAGLIGLSLWRTTGSGIALADVLARVEQVKAFRCKGSIKMTGYTAPDKPYQWEVRYTNLTSQEYGSKVSREQTDPNGRNIAIGETYFYPRKKTWIQIGYPQKKYTRSELDDAEVQRMQEEFSRYSDPRGFLKEILACKYENLGRSTVDGIDVEGFGTTDPNCRGSGFGFKNTEVDIKVWVDVKTRLPVRYESLKNGLNETGNRMSLYFAMHDFQWDVPVAATEFEPPAVPSDYTLLVEKPLGAVNEQTAVESLRQCAELLGRYPQSISVALPEGLDSELDKSDSPAATRLKEEMKELTKQDRANRLADASTPMRLLFRFYIGLVEDRKDPAYHGPTVTPKDADKVLMRWKVSDNEYRIIFGDLHAETVSPEKLAELENALPK